MKKLKNKHIIIITAFLLFLIALITVPFDLLEATDVKDYSDTAKFFAGEYKAKHRAAHSILYGLLLSPYVKIVDSFFLIKFASVFWLILIIISVYYISKGDRRTLLLIILSPVVWFMAPWLSPVPIVSLLFLWAYYFLDRFEKIGRAGYVIYAGLLVGLASAFWDSALYFSFIFLIAFFYNKKFYSVWIFLVAIVVGLIPRLVVDQIFFGFALYGILKNFFALLSFALYGGVYSPIYHVFGLWGYMIILLFTPFYFYVLYKREKFVRYKSVMIFLTISFIFILLNPHIRMIMILMPIMAVLMGRELNNIQYKRQLIIFFILSILIIIPYIIQSNYETNARTFEKALIKFPDLEFHEQFKGELIKEDLEEIGKEYKNEIFVVGNKRDYYKELAHFYWGNDIKEFISIEDYLLYLNDSPTIATQRIKSNADSRFRTEMWIEVGLRKNSNDNTNYETITHAISLDENIDLPDFKFVKKYRSLSIFERM